MHVWLMRKDVRVMTLSLRAADGDGWETLFLSGGLAMRCGCSTAGWPRRDLSMSVRTRCWL